MGAPPPIRSMMGMGSDVRLVWGAHALSQLGVAFSAGAIAVVAVRELGASTFQVAVVLGVSRLIAALLSVPVGVIVERRRKRPVLMAANVARSVATLSVPALLVTGRLTLLLLGFTIVVDVFFSIVASSASTAHLKDLVPSSEIGRVFARLASTDWVLTAIFAPLGGLTITLFGPVVTLGFDAVTYLVSGFLLLCIAKPEKKPLDLRFEGVAHFVTEALAGWRYLWARPDLRGLFNNAMLFGGSLILISPLLAVLMLRTLELEAWHYGIVLGVPAVFGAIGSVVSTRVEARLGTNKTVLYFGAARTLWTVWIALSPVGLRGFVVVVVAESLLMFFAGVFNPVFSSYRVSIVHDDVVARVSSAWGVTALTAQPAFMVFGGFLSLFLGLRGTIAFAGLLLAGSSLLLPWRTLRANRVALDHSGTTASTS